MSELRVRPYDFEIDADPHPVWRRMRNGAMKRLSTPVVGVLCAGLAACQPLAPLAPIDEFLVVALGDSYASGQGAPDDDANCCLPWSRPSWDDERCNRSLNAPTAKAVASLAAQGYAVHYASVACSGASIENGLLGPHDGPEPPSGANPLPAQVEQLAAIPGVDAVTLAIGGNDIYFQRIVAACMAQSCQVAHAVVTQLLDDLPTWLDLLHARLSAEVPGLVPSHVYVVGYPNPAQDGLCRYCNNAPEGDPLALIRRSDAEWAGKSVLPRLNYELCKAAERHGWTYVGGLDQAFDCHGWCAGDERWINTIGDSLCKQKHYRGGMHPNAAGYAKAADVVAAALKPLLDGQGPPAFVCPPRP